MKIDVNVEWHWNVWVIGFYYVKNGLVFKLGPLSISFWRIMKEDELNIMR